MVYATCSVCGNDYQTELDYMNHRHGDVKKYVRPPDTQLVTAVDRSRSVAAMYQAKADTLSQVVHTLKGEIIRQHESLKLHVNRERFTSLQWDIYVLIRDDLFPNLDLEKNPNGLHVEKIIPAFREKYPQRIESDETLSRRLRELVDPSIHNPPLLQRTQVGYYILAEIAESIQGVQT